MTWFLVTLVSATPLEHLAELPVREAAPRAGYSRSKFGPTWFDYDRNRCDTRNDILRRDLVDPTFDGSCTVLSGVLHDPYTGMSIQFWRGPLSARVQIDHVVALSNAWETGAQGLSYTRRLALANDPLNLLAVDGKTNSQKGDQDAAEWLPPLESARCDYVERQIAVKLTYRLWVTPPERDAMEDVLIACAGEVHLASTAAAGGGRLAAWTITNAP